MGDSKSAPLNNNKAAYLHIIHYIELAVLMILITANIIFFNFLTRIVANQELAMKALGIIQ